MKILALSGGGSNGDWQAGRLKALYEKSYKPDLILGISVGGLNGIIAAIDEYELLDEIWLNTSNSQIFRKRRNVLIGGNYFFHRIGLTKPFKGVYDTSPLRKLISKHLLGKVVKTDYYCGIVMIRENEPDAYLKYQINAGDTLSENHVDMILATASIPVLFDPVEVGNLMFVDGGIIHQSPLDHIIRTSPASEVTAIACHNLDPVRTRQPRDLIQFTEWSVSRLLRNQFVAQWENMKKWNQAAYQAMQQSMELVIDGHKVKYLNLDLHFPPYPLGDSLDFSQSKTSVNFRNGYIGYSS